MKCATITIAPVTNGYIITAHDQDSNLIDTRVATSIRGYDNDSLTNQLESLVGLIEAAKLNGLNGLNAVLPRPGDDILA